MDPNVLLDIAVEEFSCVPEGQGYSVDQFLAHAAIETTNGAKGLFSASELGSPTGSPSGSRKTTRRSVALVERALLTQPQTQAILEELSFMWMLRHHPHVIDYSNCFLTPNFLAITGECANMGTLRNFLKRFSRANMRSQFQQQAPATTTGVPAAPARFLFQQLVMVVDYCHRINESISGALTPDNVVICWNGSAPQVKIAATGQSGALSPAASPLLPSFAFKAPERILSGANALSDDIFSLGALLFFALTGRQPFPVAEGEIQEAWASRVAHLDLDIPQHVSNTEGLHNLLRGMLAPPELRWTLTDIEQHPFFTTNLPEGALKLSDKVACADQGADPETQRVFRSLQKLLANCGEQPPQPSACHTQSTHVHTEPVSQPQYVGAPVHVGMHVGSFPSGPAVATASGYTAVASKELSLQLGGDFEGICSSALDGDNTMTSMKMETSGGGCGAIGEGLELRDAHQLQKQRSHELAHVYNDMHVGEDIRLIEV